MHDEEEVEKGNADLDLMSFPTTAPHPDFHIDPAIFQTQSSDDAPNSPSLLEDAPSLAPQVYNLDLFGANSSSWISFLKDFPSASTYTNVVSDFLKWYIDNVSETPRDNIPGDMVMYFDYLRSITKNDSDEPQKVPRPCQVLLHPCKANSFPALPHLESLATHSAAKSSSTTHSARRRHRRHRARHRLPSTS